MKSDAKKTANNKSFKKFRLTASGKEHAKRGSATRSAKISASPALKHRRWMNVLACRIVNGSLRTSPVFAAKTGFSSAEELRLVLQSSFSDPMTFSNYGTEWTIEHRIPQQAYDFSDPEDVRRCWTPRNLNSAPRASNSTKSWKIIDSECLCAGVECFPKSWNGSIPDDVQKEAMHTSFRMGVQA